LPLQTSKSIHHEKTYLRIVGIIFLLALAGGIYYIHLLTPVITGYAAKNLASGVFVGNRTQESIESTDLNFSFIKFTNNTIDFEKKEVTSRFLWASSKAIYIEGFGCTLVRATRLKSAIALTKSFHCLPSILTR